MIVTGKKTSSDRSASKAEAPWTLAFAIVMLLLFALFLVLYSTSKKEALQLRSELAEMKSREKKAPPVAAAAPLDAPSTAGAENAALQAAILNDAKSFLATDASGGNAKGNSDVEVLDLADGSFLVRVAAPKLFGVGQSHFSPEMKPFVDRLGELILKSGRRVRIEGHADFDDSEAIQRKASLYLNTWELSAARSAGMAQYWMRKYSFDPVKVEVSAFGKYRPLEKAAARNPQANRRIEVVILRAER